jgi:conjugative transfer pilus assembly protein TraH
MKIYLYFTLLTVCLFSEITASVKKDLAKFYGKLGTYSHIDQAEVYHSQRAGYMTGGGMSMRNHVSDIKLAHIQLPSFDAGCGGIDVFAGGFSFINHQQLVHTLKDIASAAQGYAFMLAIESSSPLVANTMKQMQSWANTINSLGINSCETATQLVGAVWPQNSAAKQHICNATQGKKGIFSDYIDARQQCSQKDQFSDAMDNLNKDTRFQHLLGEEYNIAWEAIQKQPFLVKNKDLAELFMGITGTIIVRKEKGQDSFERLPSKVYDEKFLKALLYGGTTNTYQCAQAMDNTRNEKCLLVDKIEISISADDSFQGRIKKMLDSMYHKAMEDIALTDEEKELLTQTRIPIYQVVNVLSVYKKGSCPIDLHEVAELVAIDILNQSLNEVVQSMRFSTLQLAKSQMFEFEIKDYLEELTRVEEAIRVFEARHTNRLELENQLILRIELLEKNLSSKFSVFR